MRVLFPLDVPTFSPGNPYVLHLMESLIHQPEISHVGSGWAALYWPKPNWDVVHIQWPEALVGWKAPNPTQIETLQSALQRARRYAGIVVTVHNYQAQDRMGALGPQLYEAVYRNADAFVHLGRSSLEWFLATNQRSDPSIHEVIEHGDYRFYDRLTPDDALVPRAATRTKNFLVFGAIRRKEEMLLAQNAFEVARLPSAKLIFAGKLELDARMDNVSANPNIVRHHKRVPDSQVKPLFHASKFVFIPRGGRLNSGVIALAFTFGIPVIAPHEGVIGEIVEAVENISFVPGDQSSAAEALRKAYSLSDQAYQAMCDRVRSYRESTMDWPTLARKHVALYQRARAARVESSAQLGDLIVTPPAF